MNAVHSAVNAHTHLYSGLVPLGMPPPEHAPRRFVEILERVWWRLDRALDERSLAAAARLYLAEALLAGTTALVDHHESPALIEGSLDILADAAEALGARLLVCYGATERNGGREEARRGLAECRRFILSNRRPHVRGAVALHASFTVSDATVLDAAHHCRDLGALMHVHVAEDAADVEDARERGYPGPLERLLALEALPPGSICAHGVHLSPVQVARATRDGLWLVQSPRSNEGNRVGYGASLGADPRVALGTDGYPANMGDEAAALARLGAAHGAPDDVVARRLAASRALARTLFGEGIDGDTVERDASGAVTRVVVGGRVVVDDGRLTGGDLDTIRAEAAREAERLWVRMRAL